MDNHLQEAFGSSILDGRSQVTELKNEHYSTSLNTSTEWKKPKALEETLKEVDAFNLNLMPKNMMGWVKDVSHRMQSPPDFAAVGMMVSLSSVIGRKCGIHPKQKDDWLVIPNLWGIVVGRPSAMKSPSLEEAIKALKRLEIEEKAIFDVAKRDYEADICLQKLAQEQVQKEARVAIKEKKPQKARDLLQTENEEIKIPTRKRYIANDCTVEKLGELLNENPNGILLFRDELTGWIKNLNREDKANDRTFYLEAWNGNGRYCYDRIGRGTIDIEAACVSVLGTIQPSKLEGMIRGAVKGYSDDGLLQRFQLAVYPDIPKNWKYIDQHPSQTAKDEIFNVFKRISDWQPITADNTFFALRFDNEAQELFSEWLTELEEELRKPDIHPILEAHLKKYSSLAPSLALILFIVENETINTDSKINKDTLIKALAWCEYLRTHAERIFAIGCDASIRNAKTLKGKIEQGKLQDGFGTGEIKRAGWTGLNDLSDIKEALEVLCEFGYLREITTKNLAGGRPSTKYLIHPDFLPKP